MRKNILKLLVSILFISLTAKVYAETQAELLFRTVIPEATKITKGLLKSAGTKVSPVDGSITGDLGVTFLLDTNSMEGIKFIITSSVETTAGTRSAYDGSGNILFTNMSNLPTDADVSQALSHSGNNNNVIAYPVTILTTSPLTYTFKSNDETYGNCYIINMNGEAEGSVTQNIGPSPISGTFSTTRDTAGSYQTTLTVTASEI